MTSAHTAPTPALVSDKRLTWVSLVLALGMFITLLDTTIVNIALDRLHVVFDASVTQTQWIATGYLLAFVAVIPVSGWLSERFGARKVWLFAIGAFLVGSLLCGLATTLPELVAFRVLQGVGGGMVMPLTMSIATRAAGPARVHRATTVVALPGLLGPVLGSVLGGAIVEYWSWEWLFFVNVPVCLAALAFGIILLPRNHGVRGHRLDVLGFLLLTPSVVALAYGISQTSGENGFGELSAWLPMVAGVVLLLGFVIHALTTRRDPIVDVRVFVRRSFGVGSLITLMSGFSTYALAFLLPLFYQQIRGESVFHTGLLLIATALGTMFFFIVVRNFAARLDGRVVVAGGVALTMLGTIPFALAGTSGSEILLLIGQFAQGLGFAATTFPVLALALSGLSHGEAPHGSAAFSVVQRVGAPFGIAVVAVILQRLSQDATSLQEGLDAFAGTFWWTLGLSIIPFVLAFFLPQGKAAETDNTSSHG
ncbi:MDR family MFS transporter [Microbacterium marinilacus]|uniref:MDR family MFS transporter n=1 Tax=Microbacterium marinilacus TaxID=415209 RepID=A0ABP7BQ19_9MICO|nr:MDR family MFS transporter [Microbacterium marinilacus]MBY0690473.1 multidrug efflux MFS transporter [Microbacterium marinilacus]